MVKEKQIMGEKVKKKRELKALNPMLFLVAILLIVTVASYIVPAGSYDRVLVGEQEVVDPNSYHTVEKSPISLFSLLMSVTLGYAAGSSNYLFPSDHRCHVRDFGWYWCD